MRKIALIMLISTCLFAQDTTKINQKLQEKQAELTQLQEQLKEADLNIIRAKAIVYDLLVKQQAILAEGNQLVEEKRKISSPKK